MLSCRLCRKFLEEVTSPEHAEAVLAKHYAEWHVGHDVPKPTIA